MMKKEKIETLWRKIEDLRDDLVGEFWEYIDDNGHKEVISGSYEDKFELVDHIMDKVNEIVRIAEPKI